MTQLRASMLHKKFEGLCIGQVPAIAADPFLQIIRIAAIRQHFVAVVGFEEGRITLFEMLNHFAARETDIGEYTNGDLLVTHQETMRIDRIVRFPECFYRKTADRDSLLFSEFLYKMRFDPNAAFAMCMGGDINGELVFFRQPADARDMI